MLIQLEGFGLFIMNSSSACCNLLNENVHTEDKIIHCVVHLLMFQELLCRAKKVAEL